MDIDITLFVKRHFSFILSFGFIIWFYYYLIHETDCVFINFITWLLVISVLTGALLTQSNAVIVIISTLIYITGHFPFTAFLLLFFLNL